MGWWPFGSKKEDSDTKELTEVSNVKGLEEMTDLEKYELYISFLGLKVSSFRRITNDRHTPQLDIDTRKVLKDYSGTDMIAFIFEQLSNLELLKSDFRNMANWVNSGAKANLTTFDKKKNDIGRKVHNYYSIAQLISIKVLNSPAKESLKNLNSVNKDYDNISIGMLINFVNAAEAADKFYNDICAKRETAKTAYTLSKSKSDASILKN